MLNTVNFSCQWTGVDMINERMKQDRKNLVDYINKEIKIGTVDSVGRAVDILESKKLTVPSLTELYNLLSQTQPSERDSQFATYILELQEKANNEAKNLLNI